jgi:hypothetical protein
VVALGIGALAVGVAAFAAWEIRDLLARRSAAISAAREWTIKGPPCASLNAAEFRARGLSAPKAFEYEGVVMARRYGHVDCRMLRTNGGRGFSSFALCQFTGPGALHVKTGKTEAWFETGAGQPATVSTEGGVPRCVLNSKFRLQGGRLTYG